MIYLVLQDTQRQEGQTGGWGEAVTTQEVLKDPDGEEGRAQGISGGNPWGLGICSCCPLRHHLYHHGSGQGTEADGTGGAATRHWQDKGG